MTTTPLAQRDVQTTAYRIAAMLVGIGTVHFLAPKPFDDIVPAELPGDARFYTYASGVVEIATGALLVPRRTAVVEQVVVDAHRRTGAPAAAGPDDHHGAEDPPQQLAEFP
jgi:hypothetical protein